jgi:peroxiredoxin
MAATSSTMLELGTPVPDFQLPDLEGKSISPKTFAESKGLLVAFICPHCPYVKHIRSEFARFARDYQGRGLGVIAINSNDPVAFPDDGVAGMKQETREVGYSFPYLVDSSQAVAKAFKAACTPDLFLFDRARRLAYRGQFDASRPGSQIPVTGADLRAAADAVLAGAPVPGDQKASIGCNIKWKPGNEPEYFK